MFINFVFFFFFFFFSYREQSVPVVRFKSGVGGPRALSCRATHLRVVLTTRDAWGADSKRRAAHRRCLNDVRRVWR
jgi:hypothetical protein